MTLVLDTSALWHPTLLRRLTEAHGRGLRVDVVLPAVAYAERYRQLARDARDMLRWQTDLENAGIRVEPFTEAEAERLRGLDDETWRAHARDFLVTAHVHGPDRVAVASDTGEAWHRVPLIDPDAAQDFLERLLDGPGWAAGRERTR